MTGLARRHATAQRRMAGSFGFEAEKICRSPSALLPRIRATPKDMLLLANGFSCPRADRALHRAAGGAYGGGDGVKPGVDPSAQVSGSPHEPDQHVILAPFPRSGGSE